jgi:hypothetical protein
MNNKYNHKKRNSSDNSRVSYSNTLGDFLSSEQLKKLKEYNGKKTNQEKTKKEKGT